MIEGDNMTQVLQRRWGQLYDLVATEVGIVGTSGFTYEVSYSL